MPSNAGPRGAGSKPTKAAASNNTVVSRGTAPGMQQTNNPYALIDQSHENRSPSPSHSLQNGASTLPTGGPTNPAPSVNRKKQKRREKEKAARMAAEQQQPSAKLNTAPQAAKGPYRDVRNGYPESQTPANGFDNGASEYDDADADQYEPAEGDDLYYTDDEGHLNPRTFEPPPNGYLSRTTAQQQPGSKKSKKKNKGKGSPPPHQNYHSSYELPTPYSQHPPPPPPPPRDLVGSARVSSKDRIWNTSTQEERERIKEFWLSLGEDDRRSLVKVEKEAVLKKMKEQQKHSCTCTVCGRKRTAIEEELEVLYDAYYQELEQYANHQQISIVDGTPIMPPHGFRHPMSRYPPPSRHPPPLNYHRASRGRVHVPDDADATDEEFSEEGFEDEAEDGMNVEVGDEDFDSEEPVDEPLPPQANDFFNFGNSLTVQGAPALGK